VNPLTRTHFIIDAGSNEAKPLVNNYNAWRIVASQFESKTFGL